MKALAMFPSTREVQLIDHPEPEIAGPLDIKLRVLEVGICGTDREIATFQYGAPPPGSPYLVIGHEALGEVIEVGRDVTSLVPGNLAALMVRRPCSHAHCGPCRSGRPDFCLTGDFTERGIKGAHGYMTEFIVEEEQYVVRVPSDLRSVGVLLEPLTVGEKAAEQVQVLRQRIPGALQDDPSNLHALVLGAGSIGLLGAMMLLDAGFNTWVYSREDAGSLNADIATAIGAQYVSAGKHSLGALARMVDNISLIFEATGAAKVSFDALGVLGVNGVFIFTGVPGLGGPIEIHATRIMRNLVLHNQLICGTVNAGRSSFEEGVRDMESFMRRFPDAVRSLVTARVTLDEAGEAVLSGEGIKNVVTMT